MGKATYDKILYEEMKLADKQPIVGGRTREQLTAQIEAINDVMRGPLDNATRIEFAADRRHLRRELEALK